MGKTSFSLLILAALSGYVFLKSQKGSELLSQIGLSPISTQPASPTNPQAALSPERAAPAPALPRAVPDQPPPPAQARATPQAALTFEALQGQTLGQLGIPGVPLQAVAQAAIVGNPGNQARQAGVISQAAGVAQSPGGGAIAVTQISSGRRVYASPQVISWGGYRAGW